MDQLISLTTLIPWIDYYFPSLSEYTKFVIPTIMTLATLLGIFTNLLPEPGHVYPVPDTHDLETELGDSGKLILKLAKSARAVMLGLNWFLASSLYRVFYTSTNAVSAFLTRLKGGTPKTSKDS